MTILETPNVSALPPVDLAVSEDVREAIEAARGAGEVKQQATAELKAAEAAVSQADAADRAAAQTALAKSKEMPEADAGPKAREALEAAKRKLEAADENYRQRVFALTDLMIENREEWIGKLNEDLADAHAEVSAAVAALHGGRDKVRKIARAIDELSYFKASSRPGRRLNVWGAVGFNTRRSGKLSSEDQREQVLRTIRNRGRFSINEGDIDGLLVEIELIALGERPWR